MSKNNHLPRSTKSRSGDTARRGSKKTGDLLEKNKNNEKDLVADLLEDFSPGGSDAEGDGDDVFAISGEERAGFLLDGGGLEETANTGFEKDLRILGVYTEAGPG